MYRFLPPPGRQQCGGPRISDTLCFLKFAKTLKKTSYFIIFKNRIGLWKFAASGSSNRYHYRAPNIFYLFFKPLLGELRKNIEVTSMELNLFFLISPSYCGTIRPLTGASRGRKNPTKYFVNQSLRNNIQIRLIKQWLITPILFSTAWHPLSSCFVSVANYTITIFFT